MVLPKLASKRKLPVKEVKSDEEELVFEEIELIGNKNLEDEDVDSSDEDDNDEEEDLNHSDDDNDSEVDEEDEESGNASDSTVNSEDLDDTDEEEEEESANKQESSVKKDGEIVAVSSENKVEKADEYADDSSDEEDVRNTIGNVPVNWYDDYEHIGYDWEGKKIIKPNQGDELDQFLKKMEDPNFWRTVRDPQTGQDVILSDKDINLIKRLEGQKIPDEAFDEYAPYIEWFSSEVMKMPLRKYPEHKRSFVPSKDEMRQVSKYVYALKMGWMKSRRALRRKKKKESQGPKFYMLWGTDDVAEEMRRIQNHIPAPKRPLPDHSESYNPPEEYLFNEREMKKWEKDKKSLGNKKLHFVPQKFKSLREVPAYKRFIRERFLRCLDLYMCPRAVKMKLTIEPEDLVPQLPSPKDLQPFPTTLSLTYHGHTDMIRSLSPDPSGQFLASASDDETVRLWEISSGRCLKTLHLGGVARSIAWNPNPSLALIAVAVNCELYIINPKLGDSDMIERTDTLLDSRPIQDKLMPDRVAAVVNWEYLTEGELWEKGVRIHLHHFKEIKQVGWHRKGDYFFSVMPQGDNRSVLVHQISRGRSQLPFSRTKGLVQCALFHPDKPLFFVATQRHVRIYDLMQQEMVKKLMTGSKWISSMAIHSGGDNLVVGTYDRKVLWFDLELSTRPYKTLGLHSQAIRSVAFHKRYPLFASTSDDRSMIVSHGMVYNDLLQNALVVPLKRFSCHETVNDFSLMDVIFHPHQPWVFSSGADGKIMLYT